MRYRGGALLTYSLNAHAPWEGYRVSVNGTHGRLELRVCERPVVRAPGTGTAVGVDPMAEAGADTGAPSEATGTRTDDVHRAGECGEELTVQRHWEPAVRVDIERLAAADPVRAPRGGAHGGGDLLLLDDLLLGADAVGPDPLNRAADYRDGVLSVLVGVAANRSMSIGQPVRLEQLGRGTRAVYQALREAGVTPLVEDRVLAPEIEQITGLIRGRQMVRAVDTALAPEER